MTSTNWELDVSRETRERLEAFAHNLLSENKAQNLISKSSEAEIWERHILDSAQLLSLARDASGAWVDIGSGAGLPGVVVAIMSNWPVVLVEPRRMRADFLVRQVSALGLDQAMVLPKSIEHAKLPTPVAVISARAVASLDRLFTLASRHANRSTQWILPKGRSAEAELASVSNTWHGDFRIEASLTDPECGIIVATDVRRKGGVR